MHTTDTKNVFFTHNGDYSGDIYISGKDRKGKDSEVVVELEDIKSFLAEVIRDELTTLIENANSDELLKMAVQLSLTLLRQK